MTKKTGIRNTAQQKVIRQVFDLADGPLTAGQAHELARQKRSHIGIATIYRAIRRMLDEGALRTVLIPGECAYYELNGPSHHHYFHCCACGKVYVIGACPSVIKKMTPPGFVHERHDIVLHGQCNVCRSGAAFVGRY